MALTLPDFPLPYSTTPVSAGYGWISDLDIDFRHAAATLLVAVHPDVASAAAGRPPALEVTVKTDQTFPAEDGSIAYTYPSMAQIVSDNQVHFDAIRAYLYAALAGVPPFLGSTVE